MSKKLTISISDEVYEGLHRKVGRRRISEFLEKLARPHILPEDHETACRDMAADEDREQKVTLLDTPVAGQLQRLGFMAGRIAVPDDFDRMGNTGIERLLGGVGSEKVDV
jgi:predicted CopG family antitoxin